MPGGSVSRASSPQRPTSAAPAPPKRTTAPAPDAADPRGLLGDRVEDLLGRDAARHQDGHFAQRSLGIHAAD